MSKRLLFLPATFFFFENRIYRNPLHYGCFAMLKNLPHTQQQSRNVREKPPLIIHSRRTLTEWREWTYGALKSSYASGSRGWCKLGVPSRPLPPVQEGTAKVSHRPAVPHWGRPNPTASERGIWCLQAMGVYDGGAASRIEQTGPALNLVSSPVRFLPPGTQCLLIIPLITELACPLPRN